MTTPLTAFFDAAVPYLQGDADVGQLLSTGESPSSVERFAFYRDLMRANVQKVLRSMYRTLQVALDDDTAGTFDRLIDAYRQESPPTGWDLNALAEHFPTFLERRVRQDDDPVDPDALTVPPWAPAVADWAYTRYQLGRAMGPEHEGLAVPTSVRAYAFDLPGFERSIHKNVNARPLPAPTTLIAWRDDSGTVRAQRATAPQLVALARACHQAPQAALDALGPQALATAEAQLVEWGILVPGSAA